MNDTPKVEIKDSPVLGYNDQKASAIDLVNHNKVEEEKILRLLDELAARGDLDGRWLDIGRTHIEQAFMAINRAVFKPARIDGDMK